MARKVRVNDTGGVLQTTAKSAIIWVVGFDPDDRVALARVDAAKRGCTTVDLKNENYYDSIPNPVQGYDFCYTDDEGIKADYERKGLTVVNYSDLVPDPPAKSDKSQQQKVAA